MKTKKWVTVLIVVAACLLFTCGFITGACFLAKYFVRRSLDKNVDTCFAALGEGFSVDEDCRSIGFDIELCSFSGRPENMEDIEEIYDDLSSGESALEFTLTTDFGGGSPLIMSRADTANGDGSLVYLYNGNVYVCKTKYAYGGYYWQIVQTMDGESVFGDMDWSDIENIDWQSPEISLDDEDIAEFLSLMGIEGGSDYEMFAELLNDPESMFLNAEKYPGDDGDVFVFRADASYFKDYFDEAESELKDRYAKAKIGNRRVYAYMKSRQNEMRETLVLSFDFKMPGINTTVNVALDISVKFGVPAPDVLDDVLIYEAYAEGGEVRGSTDLGYASLPVSDDLWISEGAVTYYSLGALYENDVIASHDGLVFLCEENVLYIYTVDGRMVRSIEFGYDICEVDFSGGLMTVLLNDPAVDVRCRYLFANRLGYRCVTFDTSDFSVVGTAFVGDEEATDELTLSALCGDTYVLSDGIGCYYIDVYDGTYEYETAFYGLRSCYKYDAKTDTLYLSDIYLGDVAVDLGTYEYELSDRDWEAGARPGEIGVEVEGYRYVHCFAEWNGYRLARAAREDDSQCLLALYDEETGTIAGSVPVSNLGSGNYLPVYGDSFAWYFAEILAVVDLSLLLG